ncbi:hypothetical protein ACIPWL_12485 [Streptomyces sp. NPDC090023]|uniref:hypothetical protein n=1 Tax=unclassified Streptomyces TaxID=2593676 RepID=UPI0038299542
MTARDELHHKRKGNVARRPFRYSAPVTPESIANAAATVIASLGTLIGIASRRKRWRNDIRENLSLAEELEKNSLLRDQTPAVVWLNTKIALDVAKLSGQSLGTPKKPIPWGSVFFSTLLAASFGYWTYWLNTGGFVWYSVLPGVITFLMVMSAYGSFLNREILPNSDDELPDGATPVRSDDASEEITRSLTMAGMADEERFEDDGQVGIAFQFIGHIFAGNFDQAADLADANWILCRIQTWLWNNRDQLGDDPEHLAGVADAMIENRGDHDLWEDFTASEIADFQTGWGHLDPEKLGGASRRRRVARDYDLVVLAPVGDSGGYFVNSATIVPGALTFLMRRHEGKWVLASHLTAAPPAPGFPPAWWVVGDPSIDELED